VGIQTNKSLWTWGHNNSGQLGYGNKDFKVTWPTQICKPSDWQSVYAGLTIAAGKTDGTLWMWGFNAFNNIRITSEDKTYFSTPINIGSGTVPWLNVYNCFFFREESKQIVHFGLGETYLQMPQDGLVTHTKCMYNYTLLIKSASSLTDGFL